MDLHQDCSLQDPMINTQLVDNKMDTKGSVEKAMEVQLDSMDRWFSTLALMVCLLFGLQLVSSCMILTLSTIILGRGK